MSPLCDRETLHIPQSQIGFIGFIVEPSFNLLGDMLEAIIPSEEKVSINGTEKGGVLEEEEEQRSRSSTPSASGGEAVRKYVHCASNLDIIKFRKLFIFRHILF